jgi:hypothetical protein
MSLDDVACHGHGRSSHGLLARQGCSASDVPCNGKCLPSEGVVARMEIIVIQGGSAGHKIAVVASLAMLFVVLDACLRARPTAIHMETIAMPETRAL